MKHVVARKLFTAGVAVMLGVAFSIPAGALSTAGQGLKPVEAAESDALAEATAQLKAIRAQEAAQIAELESAKDSEASAQDAVDAAQHSVDAAQDDLRASQDVVDQAQTAQGKAKRASDVAQAQVDASARKLEAAKETVEDRKAEQNTAQGLVVEAQVRALTRSNALKSIRSGAARKAVTAGKTKADELLAKGTKGFFEWENSLRDVTVDAKEALNAFSTAKYKSATKLGEKGDATYFGYSKENSDGTISVYDLGGYMKESLRYIRECNAIRKKDGLPALAVSHYLMAAAQLNVNWSAVNIAHSQQFNVGENLAWGYGTKAYTSKIASENPFQGWYDEEKKLYQAGNRTTSDIGHYLNIANPQNEAGRNYVTTGFAYSPGSGTYGDTHGQTFQIGKTGYAGSVDQYETLHLDRYIAFLQGLFDSYNKSIKEENEAKKAADQAEDDFSKAKDDLQDAESAVAAAQAKVTACEQALASSQGDAAAKQAALDEANKALAKAQEQLALLQAAVDAAQTELQTKQQALEAQKDSVKKAQNSVAEVKKQVTAAQKKRYALLPSVKNAKVSGFKSSVVYSVGEVEQKLKLTYKGVKLKLGTDFNLSYKKNDTVGKATLVLGGSDPTDDNATYQGEVKKTFKIVPKGIKISKLTKGRGSFTARWKTQKVETSGYQLRYSLKKSMKSATTKSMANNIAGFTMGGLKKGKTYYVQVRSFKKVSGTKYCSSWSKAKSVKVK